MAQAWDLLVRGETLVDPARSIHAKSDVAFSGGRRLPAAHADYV